ncbi:MAG TPA: phage major capsid protein, partial [Rhabdaerophilum sp.]|nr:phage major capsid protein [Rhabdaerophilum sp.]
MDHNHEGLAAPETKVEMKAMETFEAFKAANDERLAEIERRQQADVLLEEKVDRLNRELDLMTTRAGRPALGGASRREEIASIEHKNYARTGQADAIRLVESKALNGAVAPDGGYLLPPGAEAAILARMAALSPIRSIATVRPLANSALKKAVYPAGANAGW